MARFQISQPNKCSFKVSERSTDIDLVREAVHTKRNLRTSRLGFEICVVVVYSVDVFLHYLLSYYH